MGFIKLSLTGGNVTRTLHHLLVMHGHHGPRFVDVVSRLDPASFFMCAPEGVPLALGEASDNWISDYRVMHRCLGADPFGAFHPVYVRQLQRLFIWLVLPLDTARIVTDGPNLLASVPGIRCRMDWGEVRIKQIEAYFERKHTHARGAVRLLATAAIVDFDDVAVRRYITYSSMWAGRSEDGLSVGFKLRENYELAVYPKAWGRIRFEVRRKGKGITIPASAGPQTPETRLLAAFDTDRSNLLDAAHWQSLGPLLDEHPAPQIDDLVWLCALVERVCATHNVNFASLLSALLEDGGVTPGEGVGWTERLVTDLCQAGILHRPRIRRRDHRRPLKRFVVRPCYRSLINLVSHSVAEARGLIAEQQ